MPPQNPNQSPTQPPSTPHDPARYDFFMNPATQPKKRIKFSNSLGGRIGIVVGAGVVVMIVLTIIANIASGGNNTTQNFITIAQEQNEMIRIATTAGYQVTNSDTKNFTYNTLISLTSSQQQLLSYLLGFGVKPSPRQLALKHNATTDTSLTTAKAASLYDQTFLTIMQTQLSAYANTVKITFDASKSVKGRQLLNSEYVGAQLLLTQLQAAQNN